MIEGRIGEREKEKGAGDRNVGGKIKKTRRARKTFWQRRRGTRGRRGNDQEECKREIKKREGGKREGNELKGYRGRGKRGQDKNEGKEGANERNGRKEKEKRNERNG